MVAVARPSCVSGHHRVCNTLIAAASERNWAGAWPAHCQRNLRPIRDDLPVFTARRAKEQCLRPKPAISSSSDKQSFGACPHVVRADGQVASIARTDILDAPDDSSNGEPAGAKSLARSSGVSVLAKGTPQPSVLSNSHPTNHTIHNSCERTLPPNRHPRAGGDPSKRLKSSETWTDPRLRGDDDTPLNGCHQFGEYELIGFPTLNAIV